MINAVLSLNNHFLGMILLMPTLAKGHNFDRSDAQEENLHAAGIDLRPGGDELAKMVRAQNRRVPAIFNSELSSRRKATKPGQIVEVVHDDGDEEVDHDEGAEEDEGDEVDVGHVGAAALLGVDQLSSCRIPEEGDNATWFFFSNNF